MDYFSGFDSFIASVSGSPFLSELPIKYIKSMVPNKITIIIFFKLVNFNLLYETRRDPGLAEPGLWTGTFSFFLTGDFSFRFDGGSAVWVFWGGVLLLGSSSTTGIGSGLSSFFSLSIIFWLLSSLVPPLISPLLANSLILE